MSAPEPETEPKGTVRPVVMVGDPVLAAPCRPVTDFDDDLATLIDDLFATMYIAHGVGLAANQVGVDLAVFVYDCPDDDGRRRIGHICNPVIATAGGTRDASEEGCLSVPGPYIETARPTDVTVTGVDRTGREIRVKGNGYFARCLVHETEHLQGTLFIDHLPRNRRRRVVRDIEPRDWNAARVDA